MNWPPSTGEVEANLPRLNEIAQLPYIAELTATKTEGLEKGCLSGADLALHEHRYQRLLAELEAAYSASQLPESTSGARALDDLVIRVRVQQRQPSGRSTKSDQLDSIPGGAYASVCSLGSARPNRLRRGGPALDGSPQQLSLSRPGKYGTPSTAQFKQSANTLSRRLGRASAGLASIPPLSLFRREVDMGRALDSIHTVVVKSDDYDNRGAIGCRALSLASTPAQRGSLLEAAAYAIPRRH